MTNIEFHSHIFSNLDYSQPLNAQLESIHKVVKEQFDFIERIAVALYDDKSEKIKTFLASGDKTVLEHYEISLDEVPTLKELAQNNKVRIVHDFAIYKKSSKHTQRIKKHGYQSSYTYPIMANKEFIGIVFFNSYETNRFTQESIYILDLYAYIIGNMVVDEIYRSRSFLAALKTASDLMHYKDPETNNHIQRMARYTRLIARDLATKGIHRFNDEEIEHIFLYAPLHDIGKMAIPDNILQKKGKLNEKEWAVMKTHTIKGREIIDKIFANLGFLASCDANVIRRIAEQHHETMDGLGYPYGLDEEGISIEARIIAVADIFDALTNERPYKEAWSNEQAFEQLLRLAGEKLDKDCVQALVTNEPEIINIQKLFNDRNGHKTN